MVSCRDEECSETFEDERHMEVHFSTKHDDSAKEKSICKECGDLIEYYPSSKDGLYCSECQKKNTPWDWDNGMEEGMQLSSNLPDEFYEKAHSLKILPCLYWAFRVWIPSSDSES